MNESFSKIGKTAMKTQFLPFGIGLAKRRDMKLKVTIKHITLAIGILVAVVAAMMFLVNGSTHVESSRVVSLPDFAFPKFVPVAIKAIEFLF